MTRRRARAWWEEAFGKAYLDVYAHRDDANAAVEVAFAAKALGIARGAHVLDAGCGAGRHVRALEKQGAFAVGVDLSQELLAEASDGRGGRYVRGDLRALPFGDGAFEHVVSFFTSFGYFDEDGNRAQLTEMRRMLKKGGGLLMDFLNPPRVTGSLVPESSRTVGLYEISEKRWVRGGRVEKEIVVQDTANGTKRRWTESVCLYERKDLETLLVGAGFRVTAVHGDLAGATWSEESERLVVAAAAA